MLGTFGRSLSRGDRSRVASCGGRYGGGATVGNAGSTRNSSSFPATSPSSGRVFLFLLLAFATLGGGVEHHRHTNDSDLDPDYEARADTWWRAIIEGIKRRQPGRPKSYAVALKRMGNNPVVNRAVLEGTIQNLVFWAAQSQLNRERARIEILRSVARALRERRQARA
jgi:hypothetical protein